MQHNLDTLTKETKLKYAIEMGLQIQAAGLAKTTNKANRDKGEQLKIWFGENIIGDLKSSHLEKIKIDMLKTHDPKTISEYLTIFRYTFAFLKKDRVLSENLMDDIKNFPKSQKTPTVYNLNEIKAITLMDLNYETEILLIQLILLTGMRIGELLALNAEGYDEINKCYNVSIALATDEYKVPKTKVSLRSIELCSISINIIERLIELAENRPQELVEVTLRDNITKEHRMITFLAFSTKKNRIFNKTSQFRDDFYIDFLSTCGVKYIPPMNLRNTYASQLLTKGVPIAWIAKQMGHINQEVTDKYYAFWIKEDGQATVSKANEHFASYFESGILATNDEAFITQDELKTSWFRNLFNKIFSKAA